MPNLILKRKRGQVTEIRDRDGNVLRVTLLKVREGRDGCDLAFEGDPEAFRINRTERRTLDAADD